MALILLSEGVIHKVHSWLLKSLSQLKSYNFYFSPTLSLILTTPEHFFMSSLGVYYFRTDGDTEITNGDFGTPSVLCK